jgi:chromate transporter
MVAYICKMAVEQKHWLDEESFRSGVALCQTIPGATAMQTAAYVGLRVRGTSGAMASFVGFGLPAFLLMMTLSALYVQTRHLSPVVSTFSGLQAIVVAIVAKATASFGRTSLKKWQDGLIATVAACMFGLKVSPILVILLAALSALVLYNRQPIGQSKVDSKKEPYPLRNLLWLLSFAVVGFALLLLLNRKLFQLAALMSRIDLFAFGGGFASIPLMFHEIVEVRSWMDASTFLSGIALGQVTPGPIVITATFIGYLLNGPFGGLIATVAVFLPSFVLVVATVPYFDRLRASARFNRVIGGILCSFVGLLLSVTIRFALNVPWDLPRAFLTSAAFVALSLNVDILWVVLIGSAISVAVL